jgi:hypothetical protein
MSWFTSLFSGSIAEPIDAIGNVFDKLFTSDEERAQAAAVMAKLQQQPHLLQAEISKIEAQHRSTWVAGARPAIMWCCAGGLFFAFLVNPGIQWWTGHPGPELPLDYISELVWALVGLGGMRTVEKLGGKAK